MSIWLLLGCNHVVQAQNDSSLYNKNRQRFITSSLLVGTTASYIGLNELWYKKYDRSKFHLFNDNDEWMQMDKVGHLFSAYTISNLTSQAYQWAGISQRKSAWIGAGVGFGYLGCIELLDARSTQWGFSWGDVLANTTGSLLYISQELLWSEQRITIKFSYTPTEFADINPDVLGNNFQQRIMKDYNGQTYWASFNIHSFMATDAAFPRWLNVAIGYGATQMVSAKMNASAVNNFHHTREFYISFDADLNRVRWKKKWMRTTARILSFIKLPSPTFEIRSNGQLKMHGLFF
jgi:uncharacterized protein YfiM (DUF2279 family)